MRTKRQMVSTAGLYLLLGLATLSASAANLNHDLDRNLNNKNLNGYQVKGWFYKHEQREFIVYVHDGDKWLAGRAGSSLFPPAAAVVTGADFIFSDHSTPHPKMYIFKDGPRELFKVDPDTLMETLKAIQRGR